MKHFLRRNLLLLLTLTSVVFGLVFGIVCRQFSPSDDVILLVGFPGDIYLRMLKMLMLPLIISSIISGVGKLTGSSAGRLGVVSLLYYTSTTLIALLVALTIGLTMRPGANSESASTNLDPNSHNSKVYGLDILLDLLRNIVPDNIMAASMKHTRTVSFSEPEIYGETNLSRSENVSEDLKAGNLKKTQLFDGANIIGVLVYCVVFGVILSRMGRQGRVITKLFTGVNTITLQMIKVAMWYICSLDTSMCCNLGRIQTPAINDCLYTEVFASWYNVHYRQPGNIIEDLSKTGKTLGLYAAAELTACATHFLLTMPLFYFILTRRNAYNIYLGALQAVVTAFATSSSAATLPVTVQCLEQRLKMDPRIVSFILPIGMTVNMDGVAISGVMAPVFVSLYNGINLSFTDLLIVSVLALLTSVGAGALPQSSVPIILLVLKTINLPHRGIAFIISIDWFIDRVRTVVNVAGDCLAVGVATRYTQLASEKEEDEEEGEISEENYNVLPHGGHYSLTSSA